MRKKIKWRKYCKKIYEMVKASKLAIVLICVILVIMLMLLLMLKQRNIGTKAAGLQIEQLADSIRKHYNSRPDYWGLSTAEVMKREIYPNSMTIYSGKLLGYFGNPVEIGMNEDGTAVMPTINEFIITYRDLTRNQCIALISDEFDRKFWLGLKEISIKDHAEVYTFGWSGKKPQLPIDNNIAAKICHNGSNVLFKFE